MRKRAIIIGCVILSVVGAVLLARTKPVLEGMDTVVRVASLTKNCSVKEDLDRLCAHYAAAEQDLRSGKVTCEHVYESFLACNGDVLKNHAGLQGVDRELRHFLLLKFARTDFGLTDWDCPALKNSDCL
jgi:hypothetical protein